MTIDHQHCPRGHDHPCPCPVIDDYRLSPFGFEAFCDHCYHRDGEVVPMVACTPDVCAEQPPFPPPDTPA